MTPCPEKDIRLSQDVLKRDSGHTWLRSHSPPPPQSICETRRPCSPGRCSGPAGGAMRVGCWEDALPPPWSSAASMPISVPPRRVGPLLWGHSSAVGTQQARGTWPAPGISAQRKVPRVTDRRPLTRSPGDEGQCCGWPSPPPTSHCARGPSVSPHTPPRQPPHPSRLPLSREWDRLRACSEISIHMCLSDAVT